LRDRLPQTQRRGPVKAGFVAAKNGVLGGEDGTLLEGAAGGDRGNLRCAPRRVGAHSSRTADLRPGERRPAAGGEGCSRVDLERKAVKR